MSNGNARHGDCSIAGDVEYTDCSARSVGVRDLADVTQLSTGSRSSCASGALANSRASRTIRPWASSNFPTSRSFSASSLSDFALEKYCSSSKLRMVISFRMQHRIDKRIGQS